MKGKVMDADEFVRRFGYGNSLAPGDVSLRDFEARRKKMDEDFDRREKQITKLFGAWFVFVFLMMVAIVGGGIWMTVELWPHIIGLLDRLGAK